MFRYEAYKSLQEKVRLFLSNPKARIPNPPPAWMKFLPDGLPYPNIVVEVAVNHETPDKFMRYANRYFSALSSFCFWIGVKVWVEGEKF